MKKDVFYHAGECIYRLRWWIIILFISIFFAAIPVLPKVMQSFTATGFFDTNSESAKANKLLNEQLGFSYNRFIITFSSKNLIASDPQFMDEIKASLSELKNLSNPPFIIYPDVNKQQISADQHTAYAVVLFKSNQEVGHDFLVKFKSAVKPPPNLAMRIGGEPIFLDDVSKQTQIDLNKAEYIGTPAAIITLLIIFGSVVAALLPIGLGIYCAVIVLTGLYLLGQIFVLSIFTINIALLVGLCLSLDYALFFISRFRNEIYLGKPIQEAVAITLSTAGKAVFFSGIAVFVSLSALLLFPINILFSVGVGGLTAVFVALLVALIVLPAILSVLNKKINAIPIRIFTFKDKHYWKRFIRIVVNYPISFFIITMTILLTLSYPLVNVKFGVSNFKILPKEAEIRQFYNVFTAAFNPNELTPVVVIAKSDHQNILSPQNISALYDFTHALKNHPSVYNINSIVSIVPNFDKKQYQDLYNKPPAQLPSLLKDYLETNTTQDFTVINIVSKSADDSPETNTLIHSLRQTKVGNEITLAVTGGPANMLDVLHGIVKALPLAFIWIIIFSYLILLILLRSLILPLKAIVTTILSLTASYGVLVFVIQQGHFHELLNFEPQGMLDISLCIIIVCALFGFSMDYEVFLLARIKECYEKTGDTLESIILGIDQSSRIITSAAIIVILICYSFMSADILIVKAFGLGIAVAIFVDAFVIRLMLVPAMMALLKDWNWYLPKWIEKRLPNVFFHLDH